MKINLSYLAGLIDGEGYVGIRRCTKKNDRSLIPEFKPTIVISNTNFQLMEALKNNFKGSITNKKKVENWKKSYSFEFNRTEIKEILPKVINKLIIKKQQAITVMKLFDTYKHTFPGFGYSKEEIKIKESLHKKCLLLNKRGNK
jgi:hypothetical protein